ncbi:MAG: hypothetical protein ABR588_00295, partial [Sphingomicrobium sp.]
MLASPNFQFGFTAAGEAGQLARMEESFLLFSDGRDGAGPARLYRAPHRQIVAERIDQVRPALDALREAVKGGAHAAGYLAYEAGQALDPE